jgi:broad specificity phosphatase PhoE
VSPLTRALQSAQLIFQGKKIPFIVHPELTEAFRYSCDLSSPLDLKRAEFSEMDFTSMKGFGPHWYIENSLGDHNQKSLKELLNLYPNASFREQQEIICHWVGLRKFYESNDELRRRSRIMQEKIEKYRQKYRKIAVVSHMWALSYLVSSKFDKDSMPVPSPNLPNAQPYWLSLAKLRLRR